MAKDYFAKGSYRQGPGSKKRRPEHPKVSIGPDQIVRIRGSRSQKSSRKTIETIRRRSSGTK